MAGMKAAVFERTGKIVLREKPVLRIGPADALFSEFNAESPLIYFMTWVRSSMQFEFRQRSLLRGRSGAGCSRRA